MPWKLIEEDNFSYFQFQWNNTVALYSTKHGELRFLQKFEATFLKQIHSDIIIDVNSQNEGVGDGLISHKNSTAIGIKVADCLPVYLFNDEKICIIHCGWRGIIEGIAKKAANLMVRYKYVLGASIGSCCYEVGENIAQLFQRGYKSVLTLKSKKKYLNLKNAVIEDLGSKNLIGSLDLCTKCCPEYFYSYRNGDREKRNYSIITTTQYDNSLNVSKK